VPFTSYKEIGMVLKEYQIVSIEANYIVELETPISEYFKAELQFNLSEFAFYDSEYAVCENLIFPILREVYKIYRRKFTLWSHKSIAYDEKLCGTPDYIVAKRSPYGKEIFEKPFFIAVEAKKDDFIEGWGQGLAEMLAVQKINELPATQTISGIVCNGKFWEFGKLQGNVFTKNTNSYVISDLERLVGAISYTFHQAELELEAIETAISN
jgi:hypothetical protein